MKLSVLALDYDGTLTRDDRLNPSMIDAIADARRLGITVMLVTGRRLDDLRRVAGELAFRRLCGRRERRGRALSRRWPDDDARAADSIGIPRQASEGRHSISGRPVPGRGRFERGAANAGRDPRARATDRAGVQPQPGHGVGPRHQQGNRPARGAGDLAQVAAECGRHWRCGKRSRAAPTCRGRSGCRMGQCLSTRRSRHRHRR